MKWIKNLGTFLPWLIFGISSSIFPQFAMAAGMITFLFSYSKLIKGFVLEWISFLFFGAATINLYIFKNSWIIQHVSILMSLVFVAVAGISLLIRRPFTLQYAKLQSDQQAWNHPIFYRVNQIMTGVFGIIFLCTALVNIYRYFHPGVLNGWIVWIIAISIKIAFVQNFPKWYTKRNLSRRES